MTGEAIMALAQKIARDENAALRDRDDAVQEAALVLLLGGDEAHARRRVRTWCRYARSHREREMASTVPLSYTHAVSPWWERDDAARAAVDRVERALDELEEATGELLRMRYGIGQEVMAPEVIAAVTGMSIPTVERRLRKARSSFADLVSVEVYDTAST